MAEFFQTVHLREEFFPLINPRVAAVRVHRQRVYTCKIHSCEAGPWLNSGAARLSPGARGQDLLPLPPERLSKPRHSGLQGFWDRDDRAREENASL